MSLLRHILGVVFGMITVVGTLVTLIASAPDPGMKVTLNHGQIDPGTFMMLGLALCGLTAFALLHEED
jgi:hypothetical protein